MIKVDLITGFLGSGKTTFMLRYAKYLMSLGLKIGILEYDYGAVNVDMMLLNELRGDQCELEMVAAGCDADCLNRRFKTKLISMAMSGYDRVIIEPSGVFDMDMFFDVLRDEPLENWYEIGSVITIVNANLRDDLNREEQYFLASQAVGAGCIVLSRTQLSDPVRIEGTKQTLRTAMEQIRCQGFREIYLEKDWQDLTEEDFRMLAGCGYQIHSYVKEIAGKDTDISSVCFLNIPDTLEEIKEKAEKLLTGEEYGNIIRVKGFVREEETCYQINASQYEMQVDVSNADQRVVIVIGTALQKDRINELMGMTGN